MAASVAFAQMRFDAPRFDWTSDGNALGWSIAARRSILTGQFPSTHGMVGFQDGVEMFPKATLPGELSNAGYQTFLVGRCMHQSPRRKRYGFDHMVYQGDLQTDRPKSYESDAGLSGNGWTARPWHLEERQHPTLETVDEAIRFLQTWRDPSCPFFLTVSFIAPHPPLYPPAFYMDRYLRMDMPSPAIGDWAQPPPAGGFAVDTDRVNLQGEALRSCHAGYYGSINHIDDQICRLIRALGVDPVAGRAQLDNTVVIFTSDHGEMLGDHYLFRKTYPYEGSARIPFLIQVPPAFGVEANQVCDRPVCHEDLMPTILDLAGLPIPESVEGNSLLPIMRNTKEEWRSYLHGEHGNCYGDHQSNHYLTDGKEKYIWYTHSGTEQLFDLIADPQELHDLVPFPEHAERLNIWHQRLVEQLKDRPEGFSDGTRLIAGRPHGAVVPLKA
ncbi:MAG: sulfatase-like hydrolase/transferase [Kiritimatiellales bacterium]|nr:sulfatase-like hydrolase/transferase [Kiritimatiellales bacterium]